MGKYFSLSTWYAKIICEYSGDFLTKEHFGTNSQYSWNFKKNFQMIDMYKLHYLGIKHLHPLKCIKHFKYPIHSTTGIFHSMYISPLCMWFSPLSGSFFLSSICTAVVVGKSELFVDSDTQRWPSRVGCWCWSSARGSLDWSCCNGLPWASRERSI
jgi:hypothetical protein